MERATRTGRAAALLAVLLGGAGTAAGQARGEDPFAPDLAQAAEHLARGRLARARFALEEILAPPAPGEPPEERPRPDTVAAARTLRARLALMEGDLATAAGELGRLLHSHPGHVEGLILRGDLLLAKGSYAEAREAYSAAQDRDPLSAEARFQRGLSSALLGAGREAEKSWSALVDLSERERLVRPADLLFLGRALERLGRYEEASDRFLDAHRRNPADHRAAVALGDLYFKVYGEVEGLPSGAAEYNRVLRPDLGDPGFVPALLGLFRLYRFNLFRDPSRTESFLRQALDRDGANPEALALLADWRLEDRRYAEARGALEKALARNPNHPEALAQLFALESLTGREAEAEAARRRALAVRPGDPGPDTALGLHLLHHYRFAEAEPWFRGALKAEEGHVPALEGLARALIYTGRGAEGKAALEQAAAREKGFVNAWRRNAIAVESRLQEEYRVWPVQEFRFWLHPSDAPVLLRFLPQLYLRAKDSLRARYGALPEGPIRVEVFQEFGDFSVRTVGFTGFGALGACFGAMVTAVSPAAAEVKGKFSWAATAWHELAHVVTLGLSRHRIPRWFTEGISVYEETVYNPAQARSLDADLVDALHNGGLPPVLRFDSEFRGPRVLFAYYLGGLAVTMLVEGKGLPPVVRMCRLYGEGRDTAAVLQEVLGWTPEQFDRRFEAWLRRRVAGLRLRPRVGPLLAERLRTRIAADPKDVASRLGLAWAAYQEGRTVDAGAELAEVLRLEPGLPEAELLRGRLAFAAGNVEVALEALARAVGGGADDFHGRLELADLALRRQDLARALAELEAAHACWPTCADPALSPLVRKAQIQSQLKRPERAAEEWARYAAVAGDAREPRLELAAFHGQRGDREAQARYLQEALEIDPFDSMALEDRALALEALGRKEEALDLLGAALEVPLERDAGAPRRLEAGQALAPPELRARILAARAVLLLDLGRRDEARLAAEKAKSEAPDSAGARRAQAVLDRLGGS